jgi:DNA-binding beta-propeller fold protein YncE
VTYTLAGLSEGTVTVNLPAGAVSDTAGNPLAAFTNTYTVDVGTVPFPGAFQGQAPLGSLVYQGTATGQFNSSAVFVPSSSGGLSQPNGVVLGPDGNWYVSSLNSNQVMRYSPTGAFLGVFVTAGSGGLSGPAGLAFGPDRNLYVSSTNTNQVLRYSGGTGAFLGAFASAASLTRPDGLAFRGGYLYVVGNLSYDVLRFDAATGAYVDDFVPAGRRGMSHPEDLTFGPDGNLYVSNYSDSSVLRYSGSDGSSLGAFVAPGSGGLSAPLGLRFGPDGNLYVVSRYGNGVLRYDGASGAFLDAFIPPSAGLNTPTFLTWTADGACTSAAPTPTACSASR